MAAKLKFSNVLLCEHVVAGASNKHTLVNVYAGDVLVSEFPCRLAFGIYAEHLPERNGDMKIAILRGSDEVARIDVVVESSFPGAGGIIAMPMFEFRAESETSIEFVATMSGAARTSLLKKRIILAGGPNDPTALRQPS